MNYEELFESLAPSKKAITDAANGTGRFTKALVKAVETGNLLEARKNLDALTEQNEAMKEAIASYSEQLDGFDLVAYCTGADFRKQIEETCQEQGLDVRTKAGVLEIFPYRVRIAADDKKAEGVWLNRKKFVSFRPTHLASIIKKERDRLYKASFKADTFINELLEAYDTVVAKSNGKRHDGSYIPLPTIYNAMVPTARAKRDYDQMSYAYDIGRLYSLGSESWVSKKERYFDFQSGQRDSSSAIRVVDEAGQELYITGIRTVIR